MPTPRLLFVKRLNRSVIPKKIGQKRRLTSSVQEIISGEKSDKPNNPNKIDAWGYNGDSDYNVYKTILENKYITHLKKINKKNPQILLLGPGVGKDIRYLREDLNKENISPKINVFGLSKITNHSSAFSYIDKDYSIDVPFEHLDPKIKEHQNIFEENVGKNDLIIALMSTSYHTKYLTFSLYQSAIMLNKGGKAYLEYSFGRLSPIVYKLKQTKRYEKMADPEVIKDYFGKKFDLFVSHFNKTYNKNYKFKIDWKPLDFYDYGYVAIERIN